MNELFRRLSLPVRQRLLPWNRVLRMTEDGAADGVSMLARSSEREAAMAFIEFMRSPAVQRDLQTSMWMYPAESQAKREDILQQYAQEPATFNSPTGAALHANAKRWLHRWNTVVLK